MKLITSGGRGPVAPGMRFVAWARSAGGRVRRLFGGGRVLQVEEVRAALSEHLDTQSLRGLRERYVPSRVAVFVSVEDYRCLQPFESTVSQIAREEARRRVLGDGWRATAESIELALRPDPALQTGEPPRLSSAYPSGVRRASWHWSARDSNGGRPVGAAAGLDGIRLTMTAGTGEGTALQEDVWLVLDSTLALRALAIDSSEQVQIVSSDAGDFVADHTGAPWSPPGGMRVDVRPPLAATAPESVVIPEDWNLAWAEFSTPDGRRLIWCPGGVAVVGRMREHAHVVPQQPAPSVSRQQVMLRREGDGRLQVTDLGTTNGTWLDDRKLRPLEVRVASLPARVRVGELGRFVVEMR